MQGFHEIEHKADIGLEIFGETLEQLFTQAIYGFYSILLPGINWQHQKSSQGNYVLTLTEDVPETALISLLNELNFLFSVKHILLLPVLSLTIRSNARFDVKARTGLISDIPTDWLENATEIKAVTYHDLNIRQDQGLYKVRLIFDV